MRSSQSIKSLKFFCGDKLIKLISKKHKKVYRVLNYIEHLFILIATVIESALIFAFTSLVGIPIAVTSFGIRLKVWVITARIKKV